MTNDIYPWLTQTFNSLQDRLAKSALHHGLLFIADKGVGEHLLIEKLTKALVCANKNACGRCKACLLVEAKSHPDIKQVVSDKPSIGVDLIRSVSEFVTSTSQLLGNKVVVIENIELMTESASNSLLKTLEEPNNNTYLLLSTTTPNAVLATITSRCEKHRLSLPGKSEALSWLKSQTNKPVDERSLLTFGGSPIDYLASLIDDKAAHQSFFEDMQMLTEQKISGQSLAKKWEKDAGSALTWTYQYLQFQFQEKGFDSPLSSDASTNNSLGYLQLIDQCILINRKISQAGINKSLMLQRLFNQIATI
jgi:DNA polymerase-3 subunit delta'